MPGESARPECLTLGARVTLPGPYQGQDLGCSPTFLSTLCVTLALAGSGRCWPWAPGAHHCTQARCPQELVRNGGLSEEGRPGVVTSLLVSLGVPGCSLSLKDTLSSTNRPMCGARSPPPDGATTLQTG